MATIQEAFNAWSRVNFEAIVDEAIVENEKVIIDAQKEQMSLGLASDGRKIGEYKNSEYAAYKQEIGSLAPMGDVDLKLIGDFQAAMSLEISANFIMPDSKDEKNNKLIKKYGERIYGLIPETIGKISQENILPAILLRIHVITGI